MWSHHPLVMAVNAAGIKDHHPALSFSGCGFLAVYQLGVVRGLLDLAPDIVKSAPKVFGASAGSLTAAAVVCDALDDLQKVIFNTALKARNSFLGPFHPACNLFKILRQSLSSKLPENVHELASGRLHISVTRLSDGMNILLSEFNSRDEVIQAILCSCFFPVYCGLTPPTFRGVSYIDGGFTNMQPYCDMNSTITVSPFAGETDICPRDYPCSLYHVFAANGSFYITPINLQRAVSALFPPTVKVLQDFVYGGYQDAIKFLQRNDILEQSSLSINRTYLSAHLCVKAEEASPRTLNASDGQNIKMAVSKTYCSQHHQLKNTLSNQDISRTIKEEPPQQILAWIQKEPSLYRSVSDEGVLMGYYYSIHPPQHQPLYLLLSYMLPQNSEDSFSHRLVLWAHQLLKDVVRIVKKTAELGQLLQHTVIKQRKKQMSQRN